MSAQCDIPNDLRICDSCGQLASGEVCATCEQYLRLHADLIKRLNERKAERSPAVLKTFHECPCCRIETDTPDCCPDCQGKIQNFVDRTNRGAAMLRNLLWITLALAAFYYLLWQFRGFIFDCFNLWFGGN